MPNQNSLHWSWFLARLIFFYVHVTGLVCLVYNWTYKKRWHRWYPDGVLRIAYSKQQCGSFNTWDAKALIAIYSCFVFGVREFRSPYSVSNKRRARKLVEAAESSSEQECLCCWRTCHVHSASVSTHQRMLLMAMIQRTCLTWQKPSKPSLLLYNGQLLPPLLPPATSLVYGKLFV